MKRSWIGLGLLAVLLALGIAMTIFMDRVHSPVEEDLELASNSVLLGDWASGEVSFQAALQNWEKWSHLRACFADHTPTEEIDSLFAQLDIYCVTREDVAFAAGCRELARKVAAVGEAHGMYWWNFL